ncbi:hypothetical protein [Nonomuraea dietziae]|uniref:hypothetical protein n=1 Tax=Nonomuraea dietziae TaxID=65515 RepID=UPI0033FDE8AC
MDIVIRLVRRGMSPLPVLVADMLLMVLAGRIVVGAHLRGKLCDGASVWCAGGDPTPAEWVAEMDFRTAVTFWSFGGATGRHSPRRGDSKTCEPHPPLFLCCARTAPLPHPR